MYIEHTYILVTYLSYIYPIVIYLYKDTIVVLLPFNRRYTMMYPVLMC